MDNTFYKIVKHPQNEREAAMLAINVSVSRNSTYTSDDKLSIRDKRMAREYWADILIQTIPHYVNVEADKSIFLNDVKGILLSMREKYGYVFRCNKKGYANEFRLAHAQKSLSVFLKHLWCMGIVQMPPVCPIDGVILNDVLGICESWTKLNDWEKYEDYIRMTEEAAKNSKMTVAEWEYVNWSKAIQEKNSRKTNESKGGRKPTPRNSIHKKNGNDKIIEEERVMLNGIEFFIFVGKKAGIDHYYCQIRHWVKDSIDINTLSDAQAIFANFAIPQHPWKSRNHLYKYVEFSDKEGAENLKKAKELKDNIFAFIQTKLKS